MDLTTTAQRWSGRRLAPAALLSGLLLSPGGVTAAEAGRIAPPTAAVLDGLRAMTATLQTTAPPRFVLHYQGPVTKPFGPLCYRFAGYNETCRSLPEGWLTPATAVELYAPGGVPLDLLSGYQLVIRFPYWTDAVFKPTLNTGRER